MTAHIESKKEDIANVVLMPGDPKRAEYIAKNYLNNYILVNDVRGMTAYTGYYKGKKITVFPSGMGNASMGIYSYELFKYYGVDAIIRIGTTGGYNHELKLNDLIVVEKSFSKSTFASVQNNYQLDNNSASEKINKLIKEVTTKNKMSIISGNIYNTDVFYEQNNNYMDTSKKYNVLGVEMESFALFHNANVLNKDATTLLSVSDLFFSDEKLSSLQREKNLNNMIFVALETAILL